MSLGCPLFGVIHSAFPLPTTASPTLQNGLQNSFGEAAVAFYMLESSTFSPLYSCQKRFLWTHKEVDLVLFPVFGFVLQVGNAEKFPHGRGFENLDPFFRVSK